MAVPFLAIFSGYTIYWIYEKIRSKRFNELIVPGVLIISIALMSHVKMLEFGMAQSHNNLGIILKRQGLYEEAIGEYEKAIKEDPNYSSPYFNLGLLYMERGENKKAIEYLNKAIQANPKLIKAHQKLAELYSASDSPDKAMHHKKKTKEAVGQ